MREFTKALMSYSLAMSLFGLKQMQNLVTPTKRDEVKGPAVKAFDAVTNATTDQFGETLNSFFRMMDNLQRGAIGLTFSLLTPFSSQGRREQTGADRKHSGVQWSSEPYCPPETPSVETQAREREDDTAEWDGDASRVIGRKR